MIGGHLAPAQRRTRNAQVWPRCSCGRVLGCALLPGSLPLRHPAASKEEYEPLVAGHKRALTEKNLELAEGLNDFKRTAPAAAEAMGKAATLVAELAAKAGPQARAKVEAMVATAERAQSAQTKLEAFWGRIEVRPYQLLTALCIVLPTLPLLTCDCTGQGLVLSTCSLSS